MFNVSTRLRLECDYGLNLLVSLVWPSVTKINYYSQYNIFRWEYGYQLETEATLKLWFSSYASVFIICISKNITAVILKIWNERDLKTINWVFLGSIVKKKTTSTKITLVWKKKKK